MKITPFRVAIPDNDINDLKQRILRTRWPDNVYGDEWSGGTNLPYLQELCQYWATDYSWRNVETLINSYDNFIAEIDGYKIHYIHAKGNGGIPLILTHGWPGSFLEMLKMIPLLSSSFDLIIPSVPGFGFSSTLPGCNSAVVADLWHKLMLGLGYDKYGLQGGDIGAGISSWLAWKYPAHVISLHLNFIPGSYQPFLSHNDALNPDLAAYKQRVSEWAAKEGAYISLQSTKPQTLSYGLNDSPVGLCAWIAEKFHSWTDVPIDKNELLDNISLYWFTQTLPSSVRIYQENSKMPLKFGQHERINVPVAFIRFPKELPTPPREYVEIGYNIQQWSEVDKGGHFAAMEQPELLAEDIRKFFGI